jgi:hypothetical protein
VVESDGQLLSDVDVVTDGEVEDGVDFSEVFTDTVAVLEIDELFGGVVVICELLEGLLVARIFFV